MKLFQAVPQLGRFVTDFPTRRSGFHPSSVHERFVTEKEAVEWVSSKYFGLSSQFSFHQLLHIQ
jgi:hypothetical protein